MGRLSSTCCSSAEPAGLLRLLFPSANSGSFFVIAKVLPLQPTFPPLSSRATKNIFDRSTTPRQPPISHPHPPCPPPEPASQFFRIRQTANCELCIASPWQALKALTNDSLIRRKAGGVEGETGWGERGEKKKTGRQSREAHWKRLPSRTRRRMSQRRERKQSIPPRLLQDSPGGGKK